MSGRDSVPVEPLPVRPGVASALDTRGSADSATADPLLGAVIDGRFKLTALVARGGMARVYRAEQVPLGRVCAVKVLHPRDHQEDPEFTKRFYREANTASRLTHPNTVTIFDYGRTEAGIHYMGMEYLEGQTLYRAIRSVGCFSEQRAAHVARQICRSLREAHAFGLIHRDLKPANVFLVRHGDEVDFVKVLDFGLVKQVDDNVEEITQAGTFLGSPKYMAPEQIRGQGVDARTDIYALGVILYEMLTGKVPFDRTASVDVLMAHVNDEVPPLRVTNPAVRVSEQMEAIVMRAMAKRPEDRFASMDEMLRALKAIGRASPNEPVTETVRIRLDPPGARSRQVLVASVISGAIVAGLLTFLASLLR